MKRSLLALLASAVAAGALATVAAAPASGAVLGQVTVNPTSGNDQTLFGGSATTDCPAGTTDSYWTIDGPDLPRDTAFLGAGNSSGDGPQSFSGAAISNIRAVEAGSFSASGAYRIRFNCFGESSVTDTYEAQLNYTAGGAGAWTISAVPLGEEYVSVVPERLLDTRGGGRVGYTGAKPTGGQTVQLQVTGAGTTNVPADAGAVVLNVTGVVPTANGFVTVWPCGSPRPTASNLNLTKGVTTPNLVISQIGTGGTVCLYTSGGTDLLADVAGYFPAA